MGSSAQTESDVPVDWIGPSNRISNQGERSLYWLLFTEPYGLLRPQGWATLVDRSWRFYVFCRNDWVRSPNQNLCGFLGHIKR